MMWLLGSVGWVCVCLRLYTQQKFVCTAMVQMYWLYSSVKVRLRGSLCTLGTACAAGWSWNREKYACLWPVKMKKVTDGAAILVA